MKVKSEIMNTKNIEHTLRRMALEILEQNEGMDNVHLIGIRSRGVPMAARLAKYISEIEKIEVPVGIVADIEYK